MKTLKVEAVYPMAYETFEDDRLRLPPIPPPKSSGTEKKESQDRHHNRACRPSGKPSSNSSHDLHPDDALTVKGSFQIPLNQECQSSARVQTHKIHQTRAATRQMDARKFRASLS